MEGTVWILQQGLTPLPREVQTLFEPWMGAVMILGLLVLALVRNQYPAYLQNIRWSFSNYRITRQAFAEGDFSFKPEWLLMFPVMVMAHAWLIYIASARSALSCYPKGLQPYLQLVLMVLLVYVLKLMGILLVNMLTKAGASLRVYWGNTILLSQTIALPLMFLALSASLAADGLEAVIVYAGFCIFVLAYLLRVFRGISAAIQSRISLKYIILYLCTLEILPLAVVVKAWYMVYTNC